MHIRISENGYFHSLLKETSHLQFAIWKAMNYQNFTAYIRTARLDTHRTQFALFTACTVKAILIICCKNIYSSIRIFLIRHWQNLPFRQRYFQYWYFFKDSSHYVLKTKRKCGLVTFSVIVWPPCISVVIIKYLI